MEEYAVRIENVSKYYKLYASPRDRLKEALIPFGKKYHKEFYALKNIDFNVKKGEILGIVGKNGSGKSTLLKIISSVLKPSSGQVYVNGRISALLELGSGFNPEFTGLENVFFYGTITGYSEEEMNNKIDDILSFADIGDFINQPVKLYSSGMKARLGFAVATAIDPEILIVDEVLAVGDAIFQRKCYARMENLIKSGKTVLLVSHNRNSVSALCDRGVMLDEGRLMYSGSTENVLREYDILCNKKFLAKKNGKDSGMESEVFSAKDKVEKNEAPEELLFDESLKSESTFFGKSQIDFNEFAILNLNGQKVNILKTGEKYLIKVVFVFHEELNDIMFALRIKTMQGYRASWMGYPFEKMEYFGVRKGERKVFEFEFNCNLLEGVYFVDAGVQSIVGDEIFVHISTHDVYSFKINKTNQNVSGLVFMEFAPAGVK